jgi:hypothetical protein
MWWRWAAAVVVGDGGLIGLSVSLPSHIQALLCSFLFFFWTIFRTPILSISFSLPPPLSTALP